MSRLTPGVVPLNKPWPGDGAVYVPLWNPTHQAGDYAAADKDLILCDGVGLQTITLPTPVKGRRVMVIRGTSTQQLNVNVSNAATETIDGTVTVYSPGNIVSTPYTARVVCHAISGTQWVTESVDSFLYNVSGSGVSFNDVISSGSVYFNYNIWLTKTVTINTTGTIDTGCVAERYTGAGGYTRTAPTNVGATQILFLKNDSTGLVTFQPNGGGTIDGQASLILAPGQAALVMCLATGAAGAWTVLNISRVTAAGHLAVPGGNAPTASTVNAGLTSVTIAGNDTRGVITITVGAAPVAQFAALFSVNFAGAVYQAAPVVMLTEQDAGQFPGPQAYAIGTNSFNVTNAGGVLAAGTTYHLGYVVVG